MKKNKNKKVNWFFGKNGNVVIVSQLPFTVTKNGKFKTIKNK